MGVLKFGQQAGDSEEQGIILGLTSVSRALLSGDPNAGLQYVLDFVECFLHADGALVLLGQPGSRRLWPMAERNVPSRHSRQGWTGEGIARAAMQERELLCVEDLSTDSRDALGSLGAYGFASSLCAPIVMGDSSIGALIALSRQPRRFAIPDMDVLGELARMVAEAFAARGGRWEISTDAPAPPAPGGAASGAFLSLLASVSAAEDYESLQWALERNCKAALDCSLVFLLPAGVCMGVVASAPEWSLAGKWALESRLPIVTASGPKPDSGQMLSAPVYAGDRPLAALEIVRSGPGGAFCAEDIALVRTVAGVVGLAMEKFRLAGESRRRSVAMDTLLGVGRTVASLMDLAEVSKQVAAEARKLTGAQRVALYFYDAANNRVRFGGVDGDDSERPLSLEKIERELALWAVLMNRVARGSEIGGGFRQGVAAKAGVSQWLAAPLTRGGQRVGVIVVAPPLHATEPPDVVELLERFGSLAAVAIENSRTYTRHLAVAKAAQQSMVEKNPVSIRGLEIAYRMFPKHDVGGDYCDFIVLGHDRLGIVMGDVSGSDVPAAAYTAVGKHALRAYAMDCNCPAEVLTRLNRLVCQESEPETFISLFFGIVDCRAHTLSYAMAGHEPPLLVRCSSGRVEHLKAPGLLLGVERDAMFERRVRRFGPGDMLAVYTDGLTEVPAKGRRFGEPRLRDLLLRHVGRPVQEIVGRVMETRIKFSDGAVADDMALAVVRMAP